MLARRHAIVGPDSYRTFDWLEGAKFRWYARHALLTEGKPALWNPYLEGGIPSFAHPSDGLASPFFADTLLFGVAFGMKVDALLLLLLGTAGVLLLARDQLGLDRGPAAFAATAFATAGWLPSRLAVGFYESLFLMVVPLVLWMTLRGARDGRWRWFGGAAALLAAAGVQMQLCLVFAVLAGGLWGASVAPAEAPPVRRRLLLGGAAVVALTALLGAFKFVPMLEFVASRGGRVEAPVTIPVGPYDAVTSTLTGLVEHAGVVGEYGADGMSDIYEYTYGGMPLVVVVGVLVALGATRGAPRRLLALWVVTWLLSWRPGAGAQLSLFPVVGWLPWFDAMRETDRYVAFFLVLWTSLGAGVAAARLLAWSRLEGRRAVATGALFALLVPGAVHTAGLGRAVFQHAAPAPDAPVERFFQVRTDPFPSRGSQTSALFVYLAPQAGVGVLYPPEDIRPLEVPPHRAARHLAADGTMTVLPEYAGEVWVRGPGAGGRLVPGVNRLWAAARTDGPAAVVVNQTWYPGWTSDVGRVVDVGGLLGVALDEPFAGTIELRFRPRSVLLGAAVSGSTVVALGLLGWRRRRLVPSPP